MLTYPAVLLARPSFLSEQGRELCRSASGFRSKLPAPGGRVPILSGLRARSFGVTVVERAESHLRLFVVRGWIPLLSQDIPGEGLPRAPGGNDGVPALTCAPHAFILRTCQR